MTSESNITTNILLVDDRPQNLFALKAILEPLGQNLVCAESGEEALRHLLDEEFAVILLDVVMPGLDGFQTATAIKEREKTRHTPIIFLTAATQQEQQVFRGYDIGAVDYITKPFSPDILRLKVAVFVDLYRKNEQLRRQSELLRESEQRERIRAVAEQKRLGEQLYQELAESMPQIVWMANAEGNLTYCNRRCLEFTGLPYEVLRENGWQVVLHPQDADEFVRGWSQAVRAKEDYEAFHRLKRVQDGTFRWHLWRAIPVRDLVGDVISWIGTSTDIDDHERAAAALSCLADTSTILSTSLDYRSALPRLPALVVPTLADWCAIDLLEPDQTIHRFAFLHHDPDEFETMESLNRRFPEQLPGKRGPAHCMSTGKSELVPHVDESVLADLAQDAAHLEGLRALELASYVSAPILARGKIMGAISFGTSESRRRYTPEDRLLAEDLARRIASAIDNAELYEIAERERAALQQANSAKDEFLAVVSHELRSPLNAILGWVQLMRTGTLDDGQFSRGLETIERNARSQTQLIGDLLDVSRIIAGKLQLTTRSVDLRTVVESALDSVRPAAQAKGIELVATFDPSLPPLRGDPVRLQQVAWNLISNAIKFTSEGGRVDVFLRDSPDHLTLEVRDTGIGIRRDFLPYVFERFRQANSSTARVHGGLGLGLSIVRHLTELHGGVVRADSAGEGQGAVFTVDLPHTGASSFDAPPPRTLAPQGAPQPGRTSELTGLRILLVEDLPDGRELFAFMVERAGANVVAVGSAQEALQALAKSPPDILVSDIGLPGEDGFDLIAKVRSLPPDRGGRVPAIAMTAHASDGDQKRALACGFQGYIAKPVDRGEMLDLIRRVATSKLHATGS